MSTKPGLTILPAASIVRAASSGAFPRATTLPSLTARSPAKRGRLVPSTIVPPVILRSYATARPPCLGVNAPQSRRPTVPIDNLPRRGMAPPRRAHGHGRDGTRGDRHGRSRPGAHARARLRAVARDHAELSGGVGRRAGPCRGRGAPPVGAEGGRHRLDPGPDGA